MRQFPLNRSLQNTSSGQLNGRMTSHAAGQTVMAGDALSGAETHTLEKASQLQPVRQARVYRQRKEDERRKLCRRFMSDRQPLIEIRSGVERRRGSRRRGESTMHVQVRV